MGGPQSLRERLEVATPPGRRIILACLFLSLARRALRQTASLSASSAALLPPSIVQSVVALKGTGQMGNGGAGATRCFLLQTGGDLPNGGTYIGLSRYALREEEHGAFLDRSIVIKTNTSAELNINDSRSSAPSPSRATWDLLYDDWYGGFDENMTRSNDGSWHAEIPLRKSHNGIFLVHYFGEKAFSASARVYLKETLRRDHRGDQSSPRSYEGGRGTICPSIDTTTSTGDFKESPSSRFSQPERHLFYRRGNQKVGNVTIFTQLTIDRIERLEQMAREFDGPISAAIYLGFNGNIAEEQEQLNAFYNQSEALQAFVDVHLVFDRKMPWYSITFADNGENNHGKSPYPINLLRQIALDCAQTEWVWYLEADMVPIRNAQAILAKRWNDMLKADKQHGEMVVFVTPVYECKDDNLSCHPTSKGELVKMRESQRLVRIGNRLKSHRALAYGKWESQTLPLGHFDFLPYSEQSGFKLKKQEPYFIGRKRDYVPYDVLFMGVNKDKELHLESVNEFGFAFALHPDVAIINFEHNADDGGQQAVTWVTNPNRKAMWGKRISWRYDWIYKIHYKYREELRHQLRSVRSLHR